jgi:hypothetical protein
MPNQRLTIPESLITIYVPLPPVFGLVIVDYETGVNDARNPAEQSQQNAQNETQNPACHQDSDRRKDDTKKVAERFQSMVIGVAGNNQCNSGEPQSLIAHQPRSTEKPRRQTK